MRVKLYGVGTNDADYNLTAHEVINGKSTRTWECPYFTRWKSMMKRGYDEEYKNKNPTYKECFVCEEWLTFSNFKKWMEKQDWEGKELDKDILKIDNKEYSPDYCVFVDHYVNSMLNKNINQRGKYKQGVHFDKTRNKLIARYRVNGGRVFVGRYDTEDDAYSAYVASKSAYIREVAETQTKSVRAGLIRHAEALENSVLIKHIELLRNFDNTSEAVTECETLIKRIRKLLLTCFCRWIIISTSKRNT